MTLLVPENRLRSSIILGFAGVICGLASVAAWIGYGSFATRAMVGVPRGLSRAETHRLALYADCFRLAQGLLGILAIACGWIARRRARGSRRVAALGYTSIGLGTLALVLILLIV
jgi:hypothetical protein